MKSLLLAGAVCAVLVVVMRDPKPMVSSPLSTPSGPSIERQRATTLAHELIAVDGSARRLQWMDSLLPLIRGASSLPRPFAVGAPAEASATEGTRPAALPILADRVSDELRFIGAERPAVDLGVFLVPAGESFVGVSGLNVDRFEWFAGVDEGRPYCLAVRTSREPSRGDLLTERWEPAPLDPRMPPARILGPCAYYARHGMPGPEIQRWMLGPGGEHGLERASDVSDTRPLDNGRDVGVFRRRSVLAKDLGYEACLSGSSEQCRATVVEGLESSDILSVAESEMRKEGVTLLASQPAFGSGGTSKPSEIAAGRMLDALERRFGSDAFDRFWHSSKSVPEAFVDAFGSTPDAWGYEWSTTVYGDHERAAVMPAAGDGAFAVLLLGLGILVAMVVSSRRRLG